MNRQSVLAYKMRLAKLSDTEKDARDIYLAKLGKGEFLGPLTGYASIDKPRLSKYPEALLAKKTKPNSILSILQSAWPNVDSTIIHYYDSNITVKYE